ncbi:hypothetical protein C8Q75DRAFT_736575 [Abortiporus biennis]|nr:hypothetical protein C8Q75DRAFT_736575 [Abortiporus biennis]
MSISLEFTRALRVGGEIVSGEVVLHFPQVHEDKLEEVHVNLRGQVEASVSTEFENDRPRRQRIKVVEQNISVWTKGSSYPSPDSQTLRLPFEFQLPDEVLPSCEYSAEGKYAHVWYLVEVVGVGQGVLQGIHRIERPFSVVPPDRPGNATRDALLAGWLGEWNTIRHSGKIRRGLWGGYADATIELQLPSINSFPLFVKIPFELKVTTVTKEMKYEEAEETSTDRLFPSPPIHPKEVEFVLRRHVHLNAQGWKDAGTDTVSAIGGMGKDTENQKLVEVQVGNKQWAPSQKNKRTGSWRQETTMRSFLLLKWNPSFETPIFSMDHILRIKVSFPGMGNNLEKDIPICIKSGMNTQDGYQSTSSFSGPPPQLDLPPTYWSAIEGSNQEKSDTSQSRKVVPTSSKS